MAINEFINFPRPLNDPEKFRQVLLVGQQIDKGAGWNDEELGDALLDAGLYMPRGNPPLKQYRQRYENVNKSLNPWVTFARECNRFLSLMGFVERIARLRGRYRLTPRGSKLGEVQGDFPQAEELALWTYALANLKIYSVNDEESRQDHSFKVRPYLMILRMLQERPLTRDEIFISAFTCKTESAADITAAAKVLAAIDGKPTALAAQLRQLGATHTTADNNTKLLPTFACNLQHAARHGGVYQLQKAGEDFLARMFPCQPVWFHDIPAIDSQQRQQVAALLLLLNVAPLARSDLPPSLLPIDPSLKIIKQIGIPYSDDGQTVTLGVPLSFDFYQDIPPEVRQSQGFLDLLEELDWEEGELDLAQAAAAHVPIVVSKRARRPRRRRAPQRREIDVAAKAHGKTETEVTKGKTVVEFDSEVIRERTAEHEKLVAKFVELLQQHGLTCYEDNFDLLTEQAIEALLLEMKTIDESNEREQIMKAIGQLDYYGYFDAPHFVSAGKPVRKGIVLSRAPFQADHVDFLRSMDIYVFWLGEKGEIAGDPESLEFLKRFCNPTK